MLRLSLLSLLMVAAVSCCAPNSPRRPNPTSTEGPPTVDSRTCADLGHISQPDFDAKFPRSARTPLSPRLIDNDAVSCNGETPRIYYITTNGQIAHANSMECSGGLWVVNGEFGVQILDTTQVACSAPRVVPPPENGCAAPEVMLRDDLSRARPETAQLGNSLLHLTPDFVTCREAGAAFYFTTANGPTEVAPGLQCREGNWFVLGADNQMVENPKAICLRTTRECAPLGQISPEDLRMRFPRSDTACTPPTRTYNAAVCPRDTPRLFFTARNGKIRGATRLECKEERWNVIGLNVTPTFESTRVCCRK